MGTINKANTFVNATTILAAKHNENFDQLFNEINGNLDNDNVKASANISLSKLNLSDNAAFTGDLTLSGDCTLSGDNTISGANSITGIMTFTAVPVLPADTIDAITEIKSTIKSGDDGTLITGTKGTSGNAVMWNGDGDAVDGPNATCPLAAQIKGWVLFDGTTNTAGKCTVRASYNVTDVDDNGTGDYSVNWDTNFGSGYYCVNITAGGTDPLNAHTGIVSLAAGVTRFRVLNLAGVLTDQSLVCVTAIGTQ